MRTNAQKLAAARAKNAEAQRNRRQHMRDIGRPDTAAADRALVEALRFVVQRRALEEAVSTLAAGGHPDGRALSRTLALPVVEIRDVALEILVDRQGFDRRQSQIALGPRLAADPDHSDPSFIPSLAPDPVAQRARAGTQA